MVSKTIIFNYRYGIDIYFATEVMRKAREFESKIVIEYDGKKIKNKSSLMLSGFGIKMGSEITIYADGTDEEEALEIVSNLLGVEEEVYKQEMINRKNWEKNWKRIEQEEMEKDRNKSPEEIERELKEIVEEAATAEVKFTVGKKIKLYQNNPNSISLSFRKNVPLIFDLMPKAPDFEIITSIDRIWDTMVYRIEKKFRIKSLIWTIVPAMKKRIGNIIEEYVEKKSDIIEEKYSEYPYIYLTVPASTISQVTREIGKAYIVSLKNTLKYENSGEIIAPTYKEFLMEFDRNFEMPRIEWWWL